MIFFYVYELCFPDSGKPFYVGKGSDSGDRKFIRANMHWRKHQLVRNVINLLKIHGSQPFVKIVFESSSEDQAFSEEIRLIAHYGRRFDGGLLWNIASGGRGGRFGTPLSAAHKEKIARANRGRKRSPEFCARMSRFHKGRVFSPEARAAMALGQLGHPVSSATREKISAAQIGKPRGQRSEKTRLLMSQSAKTGWEKRRLQLSL